MRFEKDAVAGLILSRNLGALLPWELVSQDMLQSVTWGRSLQDNDVDMISIVRGPVRYRDPAADPNGSFLDPAKWLRKYVWAVAPLDNDYLQSFIAACGTAATVDEAKAAADLALASLNLEDPNTWNPDQTQEDVRDTLSYFKNLMREINS